MNEHVRATGLGSLPGTDPLEASKQTLGLLGGANLPYLPQLPERGVGADPVGRTASLLTALPVDVQSYGWRFVDRPGHDARKAASFLATDLNVVADLVGAQELQLQRYAVQIVGPFSLAAGVHLHHGERALADPGARRDIVQSLASGLESLFAKLQLALPGAKLTLQIDELNIIEILVGSIPTVSGYRTLPAVSRGEVLQGWQYLLTEAQKIGFDELTIRLPRVAPQLIDDAGNAALRSAFGTALGTVFAAGSSGVVLPLAGLNGGHWEQLAQAVEDGKDVWGGVIPASAQVPISAQPGQQLMAKDGLEKYSDYAANVLKPWRTVGLEMSKLGALTLTPDSGLARLSQEAARARIDKTIETAAALTERMNA